MRARALRVRKKGGPRWEKLDGSLASLTQAMYHCEYIRLDCSCWLATLQACAHSSTWRRTSHILKTGHGIFTDFKP